MTPHETFYKDQKTSELIREINQLLLKNSRPAEEVILDEVDICLLLKISKRHAANLRATRQITYSKSGGKIYYRLSDILNFINNNLVKSIDTTSRF